MGNKRNKIYISTLVIFWMTFAFFVMGVLDIYIMNIVDFFNRFLFYFSVLSLLCLGIALIVLAVKAKFTKISKAFFILTGASAVGMVASLVLHNLVYVLLIKLSGEGFRSGIGDKPAFFILATIICPLALMVGVIGGIVLIARKKVISQ